MVAELIIKRILIDGAILTAIAAPVLVLTLYINPRIALSDYPEDVQAAVPERTKKELRQGILLSVPSRGYRGASVLDLAAQAGERRGDHILDGFCDYLWRAFRFLSL